VSHRRIIFNYEHTFLGTLLKLPGIQINIIIARYIESTRQIQPERSSHSNFAADIDMATG
jgi:hypothetical protein